jgi:transcription-repair coupling factor (superfamily II helicase)
MHDDLVSFLRRSPEVQKLLEHIPALQAADQCIVGGISGSLDALLTACIHIGCNVPILLAAHDVETAIRINDDLRSVLDPSRVKLFQPRTRTGAVNPSSQSSEEVDSLRSLMSGDTSVVVTDPRSLSTALPVPQVLKRHLLVLEEKKEEDLSLVVQALKEFGFERKEMVESVGEFAVRGGIVDVYPFVGENPIRMEFLGDYVETIREFDPLSQRSIRELSAATLSPDLATIRKGSVQSVTIFEYLDPRTIIVLDEPEILFGAIQNEGRIPDEISVNEIIAALSTRPVVALSRISTMQVPDFDLGSTPQPSFNGSIKSLREHVGGLLQRGVHLIIGCESQSELRRLRDLMGEAGAEQEIGARMENPNVGGYAIDLRKITFIHHSLHEGFLLARSQMAFYTEHQVFGRRKRRGRRKKQYARGLALHDIQRLRREDYVVHADYGIGRFDGLKKIKIQGVDHEVLRILYEGGDVLYVNLNYINRVQKYASKEGQFPKLAKLGSVEWDRLKARTKKRVKDIARDLIKLYASRKKAEGFSFGSDTAWQKELEASFVFEDTFDQARATLEVKQDMESPHPMDRLICGDVGFGKTEVAVRAAFKAVMSGKQVAVLVPTTILALQHLQTFLDRLRRYSVEVAMISRLKSRVEVEAILEGVRKGTVDIIIGTHRLLSKDVLFKDLGLLIIDEEHRFGVTAKEKLREFRANVDTLALTATPIPRTLHFSLMGARDLSLIMTPPRNRLPIITEITPFDEEFLKDAILRETQRGGQVYFVHDRILDINRVTARLKEIVPSVRVRYAHGQMAARDLESVMVEFLERRFDVLVCTKIIESGLDIPNVNTIIINRADRFGMAELYQLRGRVGRSNIQSFAYLIAEPVASLPREAYRRLIAMREFTELGSGFQLAMRDMEIRGAGNLLGSEQSGFIESMGFETYTRILEEAVEELKQEEFQELVERPAHTTPENTVVEADVEAFIPPEYVRSDEERLGIYQRLYRVSTAEQIAEVAEELADRFGTHPPQVKALLELLSLRLEASKHSFRKVIIRGGTVEIEFPRESDRDFFSEDRMSLFITRVGLIRDGSITLHEGKARQFVRLRVEGESNSIQNARRAVQTVKKLLEQEASTSK